METVEETQRKVKSAMYYPIFIVGFLAVTLFATFTFIIPRFKTVYDQLNADLPFYTTLLVDMASWFQYNFIGFLSFPFYL